jgi:uncharacterized protein (DUF433 family)
VWHSQAEGGYKGCDIARQLNKQIALDPEIANGKPFVRGTQVPVAAILNALAEGMQIDETDREFGISNEDVRAAIRYAARIVPQIAI